MTKPINELIHDVLEKESSTYTDHPADRGGPTKYGITLATLRRASPGKEIMADDVKALTDVEAAVIYHELYYKPLQGLPVSAPWFPFLFNAAVQHGVSAAVKMLQRALALPAKEIDGVCGHTTRLAASETNQQSPHKLYLHLIAERARYYAAILSHNPSQRIFSAGWLNRLAKDIEDAL